MLVRRPETDEDDSVAGDTGLELAFAQMPTSRCRHRSLTLCGPWTPE